MSIRDLMVMFPVLLAVDACVVRISSSGGKDERSSDGGRSNDDGSDARTNDGGGSNDSLSSHDSGSIDSGAASDAEYSVGGSVTGLLGNGLELRLNDGAPLALTADGVFTFPGQLSAGDDYTVTVTAQPTLPVQTCVLENASGSPKGDITDVEVICTPKLVANDVDACRLVNTHDDEGVMALGFPRASTRLPATGRVQVNVLLTDFPDVPATSTPAEVFALVSPGSEQLFADLSYGALDLVYEPHLQWLRMSQPSSSYSFVSYASHKAYIEEAVALAGDAVDWSQTDAILVLATPEITTPNNGPAMAAGPDFGINAGGRLIHNAVTSGADLSYWGYPWANHELGHTLGLVDLYMYEDYSDSGVGIFGLMGNQGQSAPELFAFERWNLGWIEDSQVACATASGTALVQLSPVERSGGTKQLVVPLSATAAVVAESRHVEGHDSGFTPGVLVYFVDTALDGGRGVIRVLPLDDDDQEKRDAPLQVGESITHEGVTLTVTDTGDYGEWVEITR